MRRKECKGVSNVLFHFSTQAEFIPRKEVSIDSFMQRLAGILLSHWSLGKDLIVDAIITQLLKTRGQFARAICKGNHHRSWHLPLSNAEAPNTQTLWITPTFIYIFLLWKPLVVWGKGWWISYTYVGHQNIGEEEDPPELVFSRLQQKLSIIFSWIMKHILFNPTPAGGGGLVRLRAGMGWDRGE